MGAYLANIPFSFQGGFVLISRSALEEVGYWSNDTIVEDADLSCKLYVAGKRGIYLSDVKILSEDPSSFSVWKSQSARVVQGWAKCFIKHWRGIFYAKKLSVLRRIALLLSLLSPIASLSWIVVNFISALTIVTRISTPTSSIFSNFAYVVIITAPAALILLAAVFALSVQRIMTLRNLVLVPFLSYAGLFLLTTNSVAFVKGLLGQTGVFFRTPKRGQYGSKHMKNYSRNARKNRVKFVEGSLSFTALILSVLVFIDGLWFLSLSLFCYSILTLKSMNLTESASSEKPDRERLIDAAIAPRIITLGK